MNNITNNIIIENESIENNKENNEIRTTGEFKFSEDPSLENLRSIQTKFVQERNWEQFQTPRNLLLALVGEVGELAEIFQWKGKIT
jgi:dCTP diphosphatase